MLFAVLDVLSAVLSFIFFVMANYGENALWAKGEFFTAAPLTGHGGRIGNKAEQHALGPGHICTLLPQSQCFY